MKRDNATMIARNSIALFLGRFQPFHLGHLQVVKSLSRKFEKVIILVGTRQAKSVKNPFSFAQRKQMISSTLAKLGIKNTRIIGIPDMKSDSKWISNLKRKVPKNSIMFAGNSETISLFKKYSFPVIKVRIFQKISATKVRDLIASNGNWKKYVDALVAEYIEKKDLLRKVHIS